MLHSEYAVVDNKGGTLWSLYLDINSMATTVTHALFVRRVFTDLVKLKASKA